MDGFPMCTMSVGVCASEGVTVWVVGSGYGGSSGEWVGFALSMSE